MSNLSKESAPNSGIIGPTAGEIEQANGPAKTPKRLRRAVNGAAGKAGKKTGAALASIVALTGAIGLSSDGSRETAYAQTPNPVYIPTEDEPNPAGPPTVSDDGNPDNELEVTPEDPTLHGPTSTTPTPEQPTIFTINAIAKKWLNVNDNLIVDAGDIPFSQDVEIWFDSNNNCFLDEGEARQLTRTNANGIGRVSFTVNFNPIGRQVGFREINVSENLRPIISQVCDSIDASLTAEGWLLNENVPPQEPQPPITPTKHEIKVEGIKLIDNGNRIIDDGDERARYFQPVVSWVETIPDGKLNSGEQRLVGVINPQTGRVEFTFEVTGDEARQVCIQEINVPTFVVVIDGKACAFVQVDGQMVELTLLNGFVEPQARPPEVTPTPTPTPEVTPAPQVFTCPDGHALPDAFQQILRGRDEQTIADMLREFKCEHIDHDRRMTEGYDAIQRAIDALRGEESLLLTRVALNWSELSEEDREFILKALEVEGLSEDEKQHIEEILAASEAVLETRGDQGPIETTGPTEITNVTNVFEEKDDDWKTWAIVAGSVAGGGLGALALRSLRNRIRRRKPGAGQPPTGPQAPRPESQPPVAPAQAGQEKRRGLRRVFRPLGFIPVIGRRGRAEARQTAAPQPPVAPVSEVSAPQPVETPTAEAATPQKQATPPEQPVETGKFTDEQVRTLAQAFESLGKLLNQLNQIDSMTDDQLRASVKKANFTQENVDAFIQAILLLSDEDSEDQLRKFSTIRLIRRLSSKIKGVNQVDALRIAQTRERLKAAQQQVQV